MLMNTKKNILFCCLNWGLGHASRCTPMIQNFSATHSVSIASSGLAGELLQKNFPELNYFKLPDYKIQYSENYFSIGMVQQIPRIISTIKKERKLIAEIQINEQFDVIISDSRLGCWLPKIKSIYLCHQLNIQGIPFGNLASKLHHKAIRKFTEIWVPDTEGEKNLSGALSSSKNRKIKRIGWLSQFEGAANIKGTSAGKTLAIISGPEPHRTSFEKQLLEIQKSLPITIIGGTDATKNTKNYIAFADRDQLWTEIQKADLIISRAGYTTLMDLVCLNKKAILIPTPGQTEQEYLVTYNRHLKGIRFMPQNKLSAERIKEMKEITSEDAVAFLAPNWAKLLVEL
jgi:UDP:flavonoid glycosyltransferase YjiC (YdhE family)